MELTVLLPYRWISLFNLYLLVIILSCHTTLLLVNGQSQQATGNQCSNKHTCRECIQTQQCGWCSLPDFGDKRCLLETSDAAKRCKGKYFYFPKNDYIIFPARSLTGNARHVGGGSHMTSSSSSSSFSSSSSSSSSIDSSSAHHQEVVQITPQNVRLKLRLNEEQKITFSYQQAEDYPVDLYYLMDLSQSMNDDKDSLSKLGNELARNMMDLTSDFRLGFGSFVDKVVMPYVSTVPKKLEHPCDECAPVYGFRNHMSLSKDTDKFAGEVQKAPVSGNLDAPEGGFDAIIQAVVCKNQIGWRDKARRLLVFSTDAVFHYAGDGKLGGIIKPNDGECHLDPIYNNYTLSNYQDYPSISQINLKVKQNAINVIFAVTSDEIEVYRKLSQHIEGSYFGELTNDSSNVVELVREQYKKITSAVEMKDTANKYLKVTYQSNCLNMSDPLRPVSKCDGLKLGDKVEFEARIELKQCPQNPDEWNQIFKIYPVGINETLTVNVSMMCDCPCEHPGDTDLYEEHSLKCNSFGTYKCGLCECEPSHFGRKCECDANNIKTVVGENLSASCRPDNTSTIDCSGRGQCICGQCECEQRANPDEQIYGPYCECDNFSCDRYQGQLCSGPDHGTCVCGKCECKDGWTGDACSCWSRTDTCIAPGSTEVCSGHGTCVCGKCECNDDEKGTHYSGHYCETCRTCPGKCKELKDCVMCRAYKQYEKISEEDCKTNCSWFELELVDQVKLDEEIHENICYEEDENNCRFEFVYKYNNQGKIVVEAMKEPQCPPQVFVLGIVLGVIGAIVLIGLALLLIWKMLTTIQDRREFAKFEKQRAMAKWNTDENPIYKQATSTFKNPTYAGKMN